MIHSLFTAFDRDCDGFVDFNEFVGSIKGGDVSDCRLQAVRRAWESLDKQQLG
jgi:Ca2+-binding EF-hand superfamily protein